MTPKQIGRFEVLREIGSGASGPVYKALNPANRQAIAIRTIATGSSDPARWEQVRRLADAARRAVALESPHIVRLQEIGEAEGCLYLVMEYTEGNTLPQFIGQAKDILPLEIVDIIRQSCSALDHAYSHHLAHTNLNPTNIMQEWDGTIKVMDYGFAVPPARADHPEAVEKLRYLSPEQAEGRDPDRRSNIFSMGAILYELVAGKKAFTGSDAKTTLQSVLGAQPEPLQTGKPELDASLNRVIMKALAKAREDRYQTGAELVRDLELCYKPVVIAPRPVAPEPQPAAQARSQNREAQAISSPRPTNGSSVPVPQSPRVSAAAAISAGNPLPALAVAVAEPPVATTAPTPAEFLVVDSRWVAPAAAAQQPPGPVPAAKQHPAMPKATPLAKGGKSLLYAGAGVFLLVIAVIGGYAIHRGKVAPQTEISASPQPVTGTGELPAAKETEPLAQIPADASAPQRKRKPPRVFVPAVTTGELVIESSPQGASLKWDGQDVSSATPFTVTKLQPGAHTVIVSKAGYTAETRTVEIAAGQKSSLMVYLKELAATVSISSDPGGATVIIDGKDTGKVTPIGLPLPRGPHTVSLRKQGFLEIGTAMELSPGQSFQYSPHLTANGDAGGIRQVGKLKRVFGGTPEKMGRLQIKSKPRGAQITVNNRQMDKKTPAEFLVPAGTYEVTLTMPGQKPLHKIISLDAGSTIVVEEQLTE